MYNHPHLLSHMVESKRNELISESNALRTFSNRPKKIFSFSSLFLDKKEKSVNLEPSCCGATK
ncbi:hypothetical protein IMZ08_03715 [Bacillus luteolus]|uniref:Uncharacterized protein n=1 Tax=Litchfieldia luteola TaxID=682179 RepID=A0ABR9QF92_9BACI|nr:hypothetical protein [Cytobacillus luteolus]MBE4907166.1 hypothetical protein [Cytobacillus luteolus]MBP1943364.1 hypothetical protein [Cytobacillus luteolus]